MGFAWCVRRSATRFASVCGGRLGQFRSISVAVNRPWLARNPSPPLPFVSRGFRYSAAIDRTSSEKKLLRVLDSEINSVLETYGSGLDEQMTRRGFPFKIEDNHGHETVTLTREYKGEHIKVVVSMPSLHADENDDEEDDDEEDDDDEDDDEEDDDEDDDDEEDDYEEEDDEGSSNESSIALVVTVTKKSGLSLEFRCRTAPDVIAIDALTVNQPRSSYFEDQMAKEGPDFKGLDENLKEEFYEFLEIRGVKTSTMNILHEYMEGKARREYLLWLNNVKKFMEE